MKKESFEQTRKRDALRLRWTPERQMLRVPMDLAWTRARLSNFPSHFGRAETKCWAPFQRCSLPFASLDSKIPMDYFGLSHNQFAPVPDSLLILLCDLFVPSIRSITWGTIVMHSSCSSALAVTHGSSQANKTQHRD